MTNPHARRFVRSHLKIRHLTLLVELGRHRSIMGAAQAANLTQPAASKLLAELEHALGAPLFERLPRGVMPTRGGEVMIRRAGAALAEMDAAHQEVMELLSGLGGRVAVGTVLTPSTGLLPDALRLLRHSHPKVQVAVTVDTSKQLIQRLREGQLDLVVGRILDSESAAGLNFEPITDEPHSLIVRAGHPLLGRTDLSLAELARQAWILPEHGSILRDRLTALFLSQGLDQPQETTETTALPMITNLLIHSDMVVALPPEAMQSPLDNGLLAVLPFDLGLRMDVYGLVTRRQHQRSPGAEAALQALRHAASQRYGCAPA